MYTLNQLVTGIIISGVVGLFIGLLIGYWFGCASDQDPLSDLYKTDRYK